MENAKKVPEIFGSMVFGDAVMRERLPKDVYKALKNTIENGEALKLDIANSVATTMKEWAMERMKFRLCQLHRLKMSASRRCIKRWDV